MYLFIKNTLYMYQLLLITYYMVSIDKHSNKAVSYNLLTDTDHGIPVLGLLFQFEQPSLQSSVFVTPAGLSVSKYTMLY